MTSGIFGGIHGKIEDLVMCALESPQDCQVLGPSLKLVLPSLYGLR